MLVVVQSLFGAYAYFTSRVLSGPGAVSPLAFAWVRDVIATAALAAAVGVRAARLPAGQPRVLLPAAPDGLRVLACGLLGVWGSQGMSALALAHLDGPTFALLQPLMPCIGLCAALAAGVEAPLRVRDRAAWAKGGGLVLAAGGAVGIVLAGRASSSGSSSSSSSSGSGAGRALGFAFTAIQLLMGGTYAVVQRPLLARYPPLSVAAWGYAAGLGLLTLSVATGAADASAWAFSPAAGGAVVFAGLCASALAYFLLAAANARAGPLVTMAFYPLSPVIAAALAWALQGQAPTLAQGAGLAAIAGGLLAVLAGKAAEGRAGLPPQGSSSGADSSKVPLLEEEVGGR